MRLLAFALVLYALQPLDTRASVYHRCVLCTDQCRSEYRRGPGRDECLRQCFRMKALDCRQSGHGPGPRTTCSCT